MVLSRMRVVTWIAAIAAIGFCVGEANAQPGGGGFGGFGGRPEDLLRRDDVRKELELVDDQIEKLEEFSNRQRESGRELFAGLRDLSREERAEKFREIFAKRAEESQKEIGKILLPHQTKRLGQLAVQYRMRSGTSRGLTSGSVAEELGITEEQQEDIRKKAEEVQKELNEKIAKLREEARDDILQALTPQQRAKFKQMVGEPFEFQQQRFGGGQGGGRFGRGNRGGQGGGNRGQRPDSEN